MALVNGWLFGMLLQLSVGPVCIAVLQRSLVFGFWQACWMALGVALVDACYMAGAILGLGALLQVGWVKPIVMAGGALVLLWFGIGSIRARAVTPIAQAAASNGTCSARSREKGSAAAARARESFAHGIVLTLANPLTILFWAGVFGSLLSSGALADKGTLLAFATGCILATLTFLTAVSALGTYVSKWLEPVWLKRLNILVGVALIGFALILLWNAWSS